MIRVYDELSDRVYYVATFCGRVVSGIRWTDPTDAEIEETEELRENENSLLVRESFGDTEAYRDGGTDDYWRKRDKKRPLFTV